jgi:hypothetical protein
MFDSQTRLKRINFMWWIGYGCVHQNYLYKNTHFLKVEKIEYHLSEQELPYGTKDF